MRLIVKYTSSFAIEPYKDASALSDFKWNLLRSYNLVNPIVKYTSSCAIEQYKDAPALSDFKWNLLHSRLPNCEVYFFLRYRTI